jgi:hypothetical protein
MSPGRIRPTPAKPPGVSEAEFQRMVIQLAKLRGFKVAHFRKVRVQRRNGSCYYETPVAADGKGWPDLVLCKGKTLAFVELKTDDGRLEPEQKLWIEALGGAGAWVFVWRPSDWAAIEEWMAEPWGMR